VITLYWRPSTHWASPPPHPYDIIAQSTDSLAGGKAEHLRKPLIAPK